MPLVGVLNMFLALFVRVLEDWLCSADLIDFWYVTLGTVIAHGCCTAVAVMGGRLLASKISVRHGIYSRLPPFHPHNPLPFHHHDKR